MWRMMIYGAVMWVIAIYAFRRGGWAEKLAASGIVANSYLTALLVGPVDVMYQRIELEVALLDLGLLFLLGFIALRSRKFWPMWVAAFQGMAVLGHLAPYVHASPWIYNRAVALWSWVMWIVLGFAVYRHHLPKGGLPDRA
ncbi:hypothetical protein O4H52_07080 [Sphingomonadaceae bacterium G21617-S1]|nr:hypothetical protein [Sphingomonadaceae bacterium G21617-S1]